MNYNTSFFIGLCLLFVCGCASLRTKSPHSKEFPAEVTNFREVQPTDNLFFVSVVPPVFGNLYLPSQEVLENAGIEVGNCNVKYGSLRAELIYHFKEEFEPYEKSPLSESTMPQLSYRAIYTLPLIRLSDRKKNTVMGVGNVGNTYYYTTIDVLRKRQLNLRLGYVNRFERSVAWYADETHIGGDVEMYKQAQAARIGVSFSSMANNRFDISGNGQSFSPKMGILDELFFDVDIYLSGSYVSRLTFNDPDAVLSQQRIGCELGALRHMSSGKRIVGTMGLSGGISPGYYGQGKLPLFCKLQLRFGLGTFTQR